MSPMHASGAYQDLNFFRPLNWRRAAAEWLATARRPRRKRFPVDPLVARLADVLRAEADAETEADAPTAPGEPSPDQRAWREAVMLCIDGGPLRVEVEARIVAGESDEAIAAACGLSAPAVAWYEAGYFHIRDRLRSADWVFSAVIDTTFPAGDDGPVLKWFAYSGGSKGLALALAVLRGRPLPPAVTSTFQHDPVYEEQRLRFLVGLTVAFLRAKTYAELAGLVQAYEAARRVDAARTDVPRALRGDLCRQRDTFRMAAAGSKPPKKRRPRPTQATPEIAGPGSGSPTRRGKPIVPCPVFNDLVR